MSGSQRLAAFSVLMLWIASACTNSSDLSPNDQMSASPSARYEVRAPSGHILDCVSEQWQRSDAEIAGDAEGANTAELALSAFTSNQGRPPGTPRVESRSDEQVVFLFEDSDGQRLGWVGVIQTENGWFIMWTEQCG